jgi:hypothetical protein
MSEKKQDDKSLDELADEIEERKQKILNAILLFRYAKRENIDLGMESPLAYKFEPGFADYIINSLADLYINAKIKPKKKVHPVIVPVLKTALPEIEKVYSAIKQVGFTYRVGEADWRQAALDCFDNNKQGFRAIKREYLKDTSLYESLRGGKEREDFIGGMLQKIINDLSLGKYGRGLLREAAFKKETNKKV